MRVGEMVEVRSKEDILRTLDRNGRLEDLPFMPQMLELCGRRFRVEKSAHKTCDTISKVPASRRIHGTVHLEGTRCDGRAYDGCGAACSIFWKQAWLKPVTGEAGVPPTSGEPCTLEDVVAGTRRHGAGDGEGPIYVCQATELLHASTPLPYWDLRQYAEDLRTGNATQGDLVSALAYAAYYKLVYAAWQTRSGAGRVLVWAYDRFQALRGGIPFPRRRGRISVGQKTPGVVLDLQPGELVRVRPYRDILATLDTNNKNRGLRFDAEGVPYCGGTYRVRSRVERIVDEKTGRMLVFKSSSVILEGVVCKSHYSQERLLCPRAIYTYWREIWLERVDAGIGQCGPPPRPGG